MNYEKYYKYINIGALTNKGYAFQNRPWDLTIVNTIDIFDSLASSICVYLYGSEIKRILPLKNDYINEDWISNRSRYFFEAFFKWRVNIPLIKKRKKLAYASWKICFYFFYIKLWFYSFFIKTKFLSFIIDFHIDLELAVIIRLLSILMGFKIINLNQINYINDFYLFYINPNFYYNLKEKKIFIFYGINIRLESPILNIKLRKKRIKDYLIFCNFGSFFNDNLNSFSIGLNNNKMIKFLNGKLKFNYYLLKLLKKENNKNNKILNFNYNENLMFILGNNLIIQKDSKSINNIIIKKINNIKLINYNIIKNKFYNIYINNIYIEFINYYNNSIIKIENNLNIIFLNLFSFIYQEIFLEKINNLKKWWHTDIIYLLNSKNKLKEKKHKFIIFQGHHIDLKLLNADLLLPNMLFFEKSNEFLTIDGSILKTNNSITKPRYSKNDWMIINALYLYGINFFNKIYDFKLKYKKNKIKYLEFNRFYIYIDNKKNLIKYLKNISVIFYFKEISKNCKKKINKIYNNIFINKKINKIYNKIINNFYYSIYDIYIMDKYSRTLKLSNERFIQNIRNYININKKW